MILQSLASLVTVAVVVAGRQHPGLRQDVRTQVRQSLPMKPSGSAGGRWQREIPVVGPPDSGGALHHRLFFAPIAACRAGAGRRVESSGGDHARTSGDRTTGSDRARVLERDDRRARPARWPSDADLRDGGLDHRDDRRQRHVRRHWPGPPTISDRPVLALVSSAASGTSFTAIFKANRPGSASVEVPFVPGPDLCNPTPCTPVPGAPLSSTPPSWDRDRARASVWRYCAPAMPTIGAASGAPPMEPSNSASPS